MRDTIKRILYFVNTLYMLSSFFHHSTFNKIGFDDVYFSIISPDSNIILINTLIIEEQNILIKNTIPSDVEERIINDSLLLYEPKTIILYGKNCIDSTMESKYNQLIQLGYLRNSLFIYYGGLFEWCLLQDVYGDNNFPTTNQVIDFFKYKPDSLFKKKLK